MTTHQENSIHNDPFDIHTPQAYLSITIAVTSQVLYPITLGNKARLKTLMIANRNAAATYLRLGRTAASFVQIFPDIWCPPGITTILSAEDLPDYWWREYNDAATDIIVQASVAAVAPNDIQVFCDVVEQGLG